MHINENAKNNLNSHHTPFPPIEGVVVWREGQRLSEEEGPAGKALKRTLSTHKNSREQEHEESEGSLRAPEEST